MEVRVTRVIERGHKSWGVRKTIWGLCASGSFSFVGASLTDRTFAAGLSPSVELKDQFTGDIERNWQAEVGQKKLDRNGLHDGSSVNNRV